MCAPGQALTAAAQLAEKVAANAPLALQATREIIAMAQDGSETDGFERQRDIVKPVFASDDAKEGALAFQEAQPPI